MSFGGGGRETFNLDFLVKVTNQGGTSGLNQINSGLKQIDMSAKRATMSAEQMAHKLEVAQNKVTQAQQGVTKGMKAMTFGILGTTTATAEFVGMLGMWQQTQDAVKESQAEVDRALQESGKESKDYKDAVMDLAKTNRWASMTNRNLMLSTFDMIPFAVMAMHGFMKERKAVQELGVAKNELKVIQDAMSKSNVGLAATNKAVDASYVSSTKAVKTFTAANTAGNMIVGQQAGAFKNTTVALGTASNAMDTGTKAAGRMTKAMRVLSIAMKIALPLIALEIGSQAYERNWGGFRDRINEVGYAIGQAIPQMQGFLGIIKKVGESIVAIFTGNFERIGDIWNDTNKALGDTGPSEKQRKAMEELAEEMKNVRDESVSMLTEISKGDRGEQRDWMKSLGLDKDARNDMADFLDDVEDVQTGLENFHTSVQTMEALNIFQKFGLDVPNDMWKELAKGISKQMENLGDIFPGDDMFDEFAEIMKKASKTKGPVVVTEMMSFLKENPNFLPMLREWQPGIAASIDTMLKAAAAEANAKIGGAQGLMGAILGTSSRTKTVNKKFGEMDIPGSGGGDAGPFQPVIDKLKEGLKGLPGQIAAMDWTAVGTAIGDKIESIFTVDNAVKVGKAVYTYVLLPAYIAAKPLAYMIGEGIKDGWKTSQENAPDPITGAINLISEIPASFVAGLLGFESSDDMQTKLTTAAAKFFDNVPLLSALRNFIQNPSLTTLNQLLTGGAGPSRFTGTESMRRASGGNSLATNIPQWFTDHIVTPIQNAIENGLAALQKIVNANPWLGKLLKGDVAGALIEVINSGANLLSKASTAIQKGIEGLWGDHTAEGLTIEPEVTVKPKFTFNTSGLNNSSEVESDNQDILALGPGYGKDFTVPVQGEITKILPLNDVEGAGGGGINTRQKEGLQLKMGFNQTVPLQGQIVSVDVSPTMNAFALLKQSVMEAFAQLSEVWNTTMIAISDIAGTTVLAVASMFDGLKQNWSQHCADIGQNARDAGNAIRDEFASALQDVYDTMEDLAKQWSKFCNSMGANARSAAKQINKALDSIEDEEVVITYVYKTEGTPKAKGGIMSFANGGPMSAAGGKLLTTYGPQLFQIGDNPGGKESIWAIPHDNPGPTVSKIEKMYKGSSGRSSSSIYNQTINLNIKGSSIISDTKIVRKIRSTMGEQMDRFG